MAITLKTDYRKTLGLPGYSSHSFAASVEVEINNIEDAPREIHELYSALQQNVDLQIQNPGFIPPDTYGMDQPTPRAQIPQAEQQQTPRNVTPHPSANPAPAEWKCSAKQQELICKLVDEKNLPKDEIEDLAHSLYSKGVRALTKLEASGLIERLFNIPSPKKSYQKGGRR